MEKSAQAYWKANLRVIFICMAIWALVSYGFGIILRPMLEGIRIGGTDIGFWFAQQGSIASSAWTSNKGAGPWTSSRSTSSSSSAPS